MKNLIPFISLKYIQIQKKLIVQNKYILKTIILLSCAFFFSHQIFAQPEIEWEKSFGGSGYEGAASVQRTTDGGYIVAGASTSNDGDVEGNNGDSDYWVTKLDSGGNLEWEKNYGGSDYDEAQTIKQTEDGGYIMVGESASSDGDVGGNNGLKDYWVTKLDSAGNLEWEKNYGGSAHDFGTDIEQTIDGGYIVAGYAASSDGDVGSNNGDGDFWIIKLNESGDLIWENSFGSVDDDQAFSIQQTIDEGFIVAGQKGSIDNNRDFWIIKLNTTGNLVWEKTFGGSDLDEAFAIQQTSDEGYIVAGITQSDDGDVGENNGDTDCWIVKLSETGNLEWEKNYGGSDWDRAHSVQQTVDGGYVFAGLTRSNDGDVGSNNGEVDYWIVKLSETGSLEWEKSYGGSNLDFAFSIQETTEQGFIIAGVSVSNDGDVGSQNGEGDFWIVKLAPATVAINNKKFDPQIIISPNPSNGKFAILIEDVTSSINVQIFDILGHSIYSDHSNIGSLEINSIPNGIYWINISSDDFHVVRKLIVH